MAGGGGAGGYRSSTALSVEFGTAYTVTVGAGGASITHLVTTQHVIPVQTRYLVPLHPLEVVVVQAETLLVKMVARAVVVGVDIKLLEVLEIHHQPVHPKEITVGQEMLLVVGTVAVVEVEQGGWCNRHGVWKWRSRDCFFDNWNLSHSGRWGWWGH
jgi:hypothetical protein